MAGMERQRMVTEIFVPNFEKGVFTYPIPMPCCLRGKKFPLVTIPMFCLPEEIG